MSPTVLLVACALVVGAQEASAAEEAAQEQEPASQEQIAALLEQASSYLEEDEAKRTAAKDALVQIGAPAVPYLVSRLDSTDVMELIALDDVLTRIGEPAADALHEAFRNPRSVLERRRAISLVGKIAAAGSQPLLVEASTDADWPVRAAAAAGLGKLAADNPEAHEHLLALLSDDEWNVRLSVVLALGDVGADEDVNMLAAALGDAHFSVRLAAAEILGDRGGKAVAAIADQLERPSATLIERLTCLRALGHTGQSAAARHVEPLLIDPNPLVRTYAAEAYGQVAAASDAALCIALLQEETDPNVRRALAQAVEALEKQAAEAGGP
jgi:hypothetical protein